MFIWVLATVAPERADSENHVFSLLKSLDPEKNLRIYLYKNSHKIIKSNHVVAPQVLLDVSLFSETPWGSSSCFQLPLPTAEQVP